MHRGVLKTLIQEMKPKKIFTLQIIALALIILPSSFPAGSLIWNVAGSINIPGNASENKIVVLTFDDAWKSQYLYGKPILDKYGFKATFFVVCNYVGRDNNTRMNWQDVLSLQKDGMDVESHTMNHKNLNKLSGAQLDYELGQSKQCLHDHDVIGPTIIATPFNEGWNNSTVINSIAKYYDLARNGGGQVTYLRCDRWGKQYSSQTDCRTYFGNGTLTFANRYSIRAWSHNIYDQKYMHNDTRIFDQFVREVNIQNDYNKKGAIVAVPILEYHNIDNMQTASSTNINLFNSEMKYLRDMGFKVISLADLGFDTNSNQLYIKNSNNGVNATAT